MTNQSSATLLFHPFIMDASPRPLSDESPPPAPLAQKYLGSPTDFLKGVVGKRVIVRLTSGVDYQGPTFFFTVIHGDLFYLLLNQRILGILSCLDGFMNIALEQTEEYVNGAVTNRYGDTFVRGNNGAFISTLSVITLLNAYLIPF
jgi:U6 snRNA-associated Sm-like protein LSm6